MGRPTHRLPHHGRRSAALDVTARLAQRLQRSRTNPPSSGGSAAGVTPSAATGATVESLRALLGIGGPAAGLASARCGDLAGPARSAADQDRPVRQAGPFTRSEKEAGPRSPRTGRAAPSCQQSRSQTPRIRQSPRRTLLLHLCLKQCLPGTASLLSLPEQASTLTAKKVKPSATAGGSFFGDVRTPPESQGLDAWPAGPLQKTRSGHAHGGWRR